MQPGLFHSRVPQTTIVLNSWISSWGTEEKTLCSMLKPGCNFVLVIKRQQQHYEISVNRDFIIDHVPETTNAWIAGVGQAEGFKFGPVAGEYVAQRVLGTVGDPAVAKAFVLPKEEYAPPGPAPKPPSEEEF